MGYKKQRFPAVSVLPVLASMRMILSMGSWYKSGYNAQTQTVESGCILIAWTLIVRVRYTFVLYAKTFFVNQLTVVIASSITVYLYCSSISFSCHHFACDSILLMFYHLQLFNNQHHTIHTRAAMYVSCVYICTEMNIQYLVLVLRDRLRVPVQQWPKIDIQEVMSGRY